MDYRKSLVFLSGFGLNENNAYKENVDYCIRALMIDPRMINDPFIRRKIWNMICKRIEMAKRGAIKVNANFAMISGDPYALCQSMFGMKVTGLLESGEIYHKYWIDKGSDEVVCFRAPMSNHNNIRKLTLNKSDGAKYWYQYITSASILNAWDTVCDAMNGADKDGDTFMCTDNSILLKQTLNSKTIICIQKKADKIIPSEPDIIKANKIAFNDDIGIVTNYVTSMFEVQAGFDKDSDEYRVLDYRIMCGQHFQQETIDRAKGVIAKPMPDYWYGARNNIPKDTDSDDEKTKKEFNLRIVAANKPYFMTYVYPSLRAKNNTYKKNNDYGAIKRFASYGIMSIDDLYKYEPKTQDMQDYLNYYEKFIPVGYNPCIVNRICWIFEDEFDRYLTKRFKQPDFDYTILKSDTEYTQKSYNEVLKIYERYLNTLDALKKQSYSFMIDSFDYQQQCSLLISTFRADCEMVCTNRYELCNIVLDICYKNDKSKQFAWDVCGDVILENLLAVNNNTIHFPALSCDDGEFEYCGEQFKMVEKVIGGDIYDCFE